MPTYLIEIPHSADPMECTKIIKIFLESGSHLLSNADWGCNDGVHKSWFISDFNNKEEALRVVPPMLRHDAAIIEITKFNKENMADLFSHH